MSLPNLSVVVPCYNEEHAVADTIAELHRALGGRLEYTLIVVNDGSSDRSGEILDRLAVSDQRLVVVHHERNRGYGAALKTGIRRATTELIAITDADGTYPNERLPDLAAAAENYDMVVGSRTGENVRYSLLRSIPKAFLRTYCSLLAGQSIPDMNSGMRVFRKRVTERFFYVLPDGFSFTTTITLAMLTNNLRVKYLDIDYSPRVGKSKIRPIRDTINFFNLIVRTATYFAPLRVFMPIASLLFLGFIVSAFYDTFIIRDFTDKTVLLLLFSLNTGMFALLADMIHKWGEQMSTMRDR